MELEEKMGSKQKMEPKQKIKTKKMKTKKINNPKKEIETRKMKTKIESRRS
jgi:hypothetical protein